MANDSNTFVGSKWFIVEAFFLSRCKRTMTIDYSLRSVCGVAAVSSTCVKLGASKPKGSGKNGIHRLPPENSLWIPVSFLWRSTSTSPIKLLTDDTYKLCGGNCESIHVVDIG